MFLLFLVMCGSGNNVKSVIVGFPKPSLYYYSPPFDVIQHLQCMYRLGVMGLVIIEGI